jgi:predicted O-methyltransferase YrrM
MRHERSDTTIGISNCSDTEWRAVRVGWIAHRDYPDSLPVIEEKLRSGGVMIIDNMIWSGRVWDDTDQSEETVAIRTFTQQITTSPHWIASLIPIRDGLIVAYKK